MTSVVVTVTDVLCKSAPVQLSIISGVVELDPILVPRFPDGSAVHISIYTPAVVLLVTLCVA